MTGTITDKLIAAVVEITDLGELYPASVLKGRIGLDVRIERGALAAGKRVRLFSLDSQEQVEIDGIEMLSNPCDPNVVRILCSKPKTLTLAAGKVEGWSIAED